MKFKRITSLLLILSVIAALSGCKMPDSSDSVKSRNVVTIRYNKNYDTGVAEVYWGSELFEKDPDEFSLDLAKASAALCAASNDRSGRLGYGEFIADAMDDLGLEDIWLYSYNKYSGKKATVETDGADWDLSTAFAIGHQTMTAADGHDFEVIVVVCRGTEGWQDAVFYDVIGSLSLAAETWEGYDTYLGYANYANQIKNALIDYVNNYAETFASDVKFLFTGHSLGGAPVQLLTACFQDAGKCAYGYSFGSLNATDKPHTQYDIWNIYNTYDDYGPSGEEFFKPSGGWYTYDNKYGKVLLFTFDFGTVFTSPDGYYNHVMAGYYGALRDGLLDEEGRET